MNEERQIKGILALRRWANSDSMLEAGTVIIYGAGETGRRVLAFLRSIGVSVECFLDQKGGNGRSVDSVPVRKPGNANAQKTATVVIALFNNTTNILSVKTKLHRLGFEKIVSYTELFTRYSDKFLPHYWLGPIHLYESNVKNLTSVLSLLGDEHSRELFLSLLKFRITGDPALLAPPDSKDAYFPLDIVEIRKPDRVIDCGAFTGDTLASFKQRFGLLQSVRAFEPDPGNFERLVRTNTLHPFSRDTILVPCGVWSSTTQLRFSADNNASSKVTPRGKTVVQCVSIDDCLHGYLPTLIKFDIEGAELEALKGCQRMIRSAHPILAVALYHEPDHLWKIPTLVKELSRNTYKYFLGMHEWNGFDTILYAVPKTKAKR